MCQLFSTINAPVFGLSDSKVMLIHLLREGFKIKAKLIVDDYNRLDCKGTTRTTQTIFRLQLRWGFSPFKHCLSLTLKSASQAIRTLGL